MEETDGDKTAVKCLLDMATEIMISQFLWSPA